MFMGEKEGDRHVLKPSRSKQDKELQHMLVPGESVAYHAKDIFFTNFRIIKYQTGWWSRSMHYFYNTFEDLDLRFLESIKAKNVINMGLLAWGIVIMALGPIAHFISAIPGIGSIGDFLLTYIVQDIGLVGLILLRVLLILCLMVLRECIIVF